MALAWYLLYFKTRFPFLLHTALRTITAFCRKSPTSTGRIIDFKWTKIWRSVQSISKMKKRKDSKFQIICRSASVIVPATWLDVTNLAHEQGIDASEGRKAEGFSLKPLWAPVAVSEIYRRSKKKLSKILWPKPAIQDSWNIIGVTYLNKYEHRLHGRIKSLSFRVQPVSLKKENDKVAEGENENKHGTYAWCGFESLFPSKLSTS